MNRALENCRMVWTQRITRWLVSDRLTEMAERVAGRSRLAVWQRVVDRLPTLGPTEVRGYIRARAAAVVQAETDRLIAQEGDRVSRMRTRIIDAAQQSLVDAIHSQFTQRQPTGRQRAAA
jgi:hypothetical protein